MITKLYVTGCSLMALMVGCATAFSADTQPKMAATSVKPVKMELKVTRPKELESADKLKVAQSLALKNNITVSGFGASAKLTPQAGFIDKKANLSFDGGIVTVDYENNYAVLMSLKDGHNANAVNCNFKPTAVGKYLVDITVHSAFNELTTYVATAAGKYQQGMITQSESVPDSSGHVTMIFDAKDTDWFTVYLHADKQWVFYSCEVTLLK